MELQGNIVRSRRLKIRAMIEPAHAPRLASCVLAFLLAAWLPPTSAQSPAREKRVSLSGLPTEQAVPFRKGEKLDYLVQWAKLLNAATVRLAVADRGSFYGREAWHFQALAHTVDPVRLFFTLDDQFDSYTEPSSLASLQYEMYLREQGKQEDSVYRLTTEGDPAPAGVSSVRVLPGTRDPIAFLYYLRTVDWQRNQEVRCPVFDGRKLYEVRARLAVAREQVSVAAGTFAASRLEVRVYQRGREVAQTHFWVWLAHDAGRTPVLVEAEVPIGSARVELSHAE
jgi:hypothetical protein